MSSPAIPLNDGTSIPWLAYGSGTALYNKDASKPVTDAIRAGFRHIDTAQMYRNEEHVGAGIAAAGVPRTERICAYEMRHAPHALAQVPLCTLLFPIYSCLFRFGVDVGVGPR